MIFNIEIIKEKIAAGNKLVIYGTGSAARKKLIDIDWLLDSVSYFVTTDGKPGSFLGKSVYSIYDIDLVDSDVFIVVMSQFDDEISATLNSLGFNNFISFLGGADTVKDYAEDMYRRLFCSASIEDKQFYNVGAGGFYHPCWTNIDFSSDWYAAYKDNIKTRLQHDLMSLQPFPIENDKAEIIYTSHTIEHINDSAAQNMFNESYRVLKKGGVFRATTPNIDIEFQAYNRNDRDYFYWIETYGIEKNWKKALYNQPLTEASTAQVFLTHFASAVSTLHADGAPERIDDKKLAELFRTLPFEDALNYCTSRCPDEIQKRYPGNHMNWWNFSKVKKMLQLAGFSNVYLSAYGQSQSPVLRDTNFFDNTHPKISLYVEAIK